MASNIQKKVRRAVAETIFFGGICSLSLVLMVAIQTPALKFFYDIIPGEKSGDGPVFVVLGYIFCVPMTILVLLGLRFFLRWRDLAKTNKSFVLALSALTGPILMVFIAAACAWLARLPK